MQSETVKEARLVVSIDFGTFASGFALQWRSDFEAKTNIYCKHWSLGPFLDYKTVTCLLLDPNKIFQEFGHEAEKRFSELGTGDDRDEKNEDWYFFRHFKMALYHMGEVSEHTLIEDVTGKPLPMIEVFTPAIKFMKDEVLKFIEESGLEYFEESTKWVLTVPAIWDESAKQVMRSCAEKAGIQGKYLSIALEPECAGLYCKEIPADQLTVVGKDRTFKYIGSPGSSFMVVDMGGGTVDITALQVNENGTMKQIHRSIGGSYGGVNVDTAFYKVLEMAIGELKWSTFVNNNRDAELELRRTFELQKRRVKHPKTDERTKTFKVTLPTDLMDFLKKSDDKQIVSLLRNGYKGMRVEKNKFVLPIETVREFFDDTIRGALVSVEEVINETRKQGVPIDSIIVVGGYAESEYIIRGMRKKLNKLGAPVIRPQDPELAVMKGAVLYGHNEKIITARVMRYTYGVGMVMKFDGRRNNPKKKFTDDKGVEWAADVFRKHVTIDELVETGEWIACKDYYPLEDGQRKATVYVYSSCQKDPDHTTDEGCKFVGKFDIEFPVNKADIEVAMYFSGTEIIVRAREKRGRHVSYQTLRAL